MNPKSVGPALTDLRIYARLFFRFSELHAPGQHPSTLTTSSVPNVSTSVKLNNAMKNRAIGLKGYWTINQMDHLATGNRKSIVAVLLV